MARSPFFMAATLGLASLLSGCGSSDNLDVADGSACGAAFNPATDVRLSIGSFTLDQPAELNETRFRDLLAGVQPNNNDVQAQTAGQTVADDVASLTQPFITAVYPDDGSTSETGSRYLSVRNPTDLLNDVIGKGTVNNFNEGRQYISSCIDAGNAGQYSTVANNATIQFEEAEGTAITDRYRYPALRWVYAPDTTGDVIRTSQYTAIDDSFVRVVASGSRFEGAAFSASGFNTPKSTEISFTAREKADASNADQRLSLSQKLIDPKTDSWLRSGDTKFEFDGKTVDCARVVVDFAAASVDVYTSNDIATQASGYCGTKETPDKTYNAEPVARRQ